MPRNNQGTRPQQPPQENTLTAALGERLHARLEELLQDTSLSTLAATTSADTTTTAAASVDFSPLQAEVRASEIATTQPLGRLEAMPVDNVGEITDTRQGASLSATEMNDLTGRIVGGINAWPELRTFTPSMIHSYLRSQDIRSFTEAVLAMGRLNDEQSRFRNRIGTIQPQARRTGSWNTFTPKPAPTREELEAERTTLKAAIMDAEDWESRKPHLDRYANVMRQLGASFSSTSYYRLRDAAYKPRTVVEDEEVIINYQELADELATAELKDKGMSLETHPDQYKQYADIFVRMILKHKRKTDG